MKKVLIDTNIILDIALKRETHFKNASDVLRVIEKLQIKAYVSATTISDIYYISKKEHGHKETIEFIKNITNLFDIANVDKKVINKALYSDIKDFEDAIQNFSAKEANCEIIITRNKKDYSNSDLEIFTPEEFIDYINNISK